MVFKRVVRAGLEAVFVLDYPAIELVHERVDPA
jgi:hypothetical protein